MNVLESVRRELLIRDNEKSCDLAVRFYKYLSLRDLVSYAIRTLLHINLEFGESFTLRDPLINASEP